MLSSLFQTYKQNGFSFTCNWLRVKFYEKFYSRVLKVPSDLKKTITHPSRNSKIKVGVIGAGGFARLELIPRILSIPAYSLEAVSTSTPKSALIVSKIFKPHYITNDYHDILNDSNINLVVISTRNNLHAQQIVDAANAKKNIFCEKPIALSIDDLEKIYKAVKKNNVIFTVGYNRRFSSFVQMAKELSNNKKINVLCNVFGGFSSDSYWPTNANISGGLFLHKSVHFFDFFNWFTNSVPVSVSSERFHDGDSILTNVEYKNGSKCSLAFYPKSDAKEEINVWGDLLDIKIKDYKYLEINDKTESLKFEDRGVKKQFEELAKKILSNKSDSPTLNDAIKSTFLTIIAEKALAEPVKDFVYPAFLDS